jgi:glycine cleavage system H protein
MTIVIDGLYYSDEHEWIKVDGNTATIGITDYASDELGDIVFVELPAVGTDFSVMDEIGVIESVKTVSNIYLPLCGVVTEVNEAVVNDPSVINSSPYEEGWLLKMEIDELSELDDLKSADGYRELLNESE